MDHPNKPLYVIERWEHGWAICSGDPYIVGVPMGGMAECLRLLTNHLGKDAVMNPSIAHHLKENGQSRAVCVIVSKADSARWTVQIDRSIAGLPPEERWWKGLEVGQSAATIFAVLASTEPYKSAARAMAIGAPVPHDADDLGRCQRLIWSFKDQEWDKRLPEVAKAHPGTKWPAIIARWNELETSSQKRQTEILSGL